MAVAACGGSSAATATSAPTPTATPGPPGDVVSTTGVTSITVTSVRSSLPPPGNTPQVQTYTAAQLPHLGQLLTQHHIIQLLQPIPIDGGCTGGTDITVTLTHADGSDSVLHVYSCGGKVTGNLGGDVTGFLGDLASL